jgi:hypothetical protein
MSCYNYNFIRRRPMMKARKVPENTWHWESIQQSTQVVWKLMYMVLKYHIVLKDDIGWIWWWSSFQFSRKKRWNNNNTIVPDSSCFWRDKFLGHHYLNLMAMLDFGDLSPSNTRVSIQPVENMNVWSWKNTSINFLMYTILASFLDFRTWLRI